MHICAQLHLFFVGEGLDMWSRETSVLTTSLHPPGHILNVHIFYGEEEVICLFSMHSTVCGVNT